LIDENLVRGILGKIKVVSKTKKMTASEVMNIVASYYNLKTSQLTGDKRDKPLSYPRQVLYYILRVELGLPLMEIGSFLGGRDHTTIMYGVKKISNLLTINEKIHGDILGIKERLVE
jgi:chromosomal replication initiator protein